MILLLIIVGKHFPQRIAIMTSGPRTVPWVVKVPGGTNECAFSNLNGLYLLNGKVSIQGMEWHHWKKKSESLKRSGMKIRPKDF